MQTVVSRYYFRQLGTSDQEHIGTGAKMTTQIGVSARPTCFAGVALACVPLGSLVVFWLIHHA
jgi:hypothetical protein